MSSTKSNRHSANSAHTPQYIMHEVKILLGDVSTPESAVEFDPQPKTIAATQRTTPTTIRDSINPLWTWANIAARNAQQVTEDDLGKIGYQKDIDTYFQLTGAAPVTWQQVPNPGDTSSPFELSTGASDAPSYHDFFSLRIAFEDVWAELLDTNLDGKIQHVGTDLYAIFDHLMDENRYGSEQSGTTDRGKRFSDPPFDSIVDVEELNYFLNSVRTMLGIPDSSVAPLQISFGNASNINNNPLGNDLAEIDNVYPNVLRGQVFQKIRDTLYSISVPANIASLKDLIRNLTYGCDMLLGVVNWAGRGGWTRNDQFLTQKAANNNNPTASRNDLTEIDSVYSGVQRGQVFQKIREVLDSISVPANIASLKDLIRNLTYGCDMLLGVVQWAGFRGGWQDATLFLQQTAGNNNNPLGTPILNDLTEIDSVYPNVLRGQVFQKIRDALDSISVPANIASLKDLIRNLTYGCDMLLGVVNWAGRGGWSNDTLFLQQTAGNPPPPPDVDLFTQCTNMITELDTMLNERYRFDVFAPASINYGLLLNYRQHWVPQSYQVGDLVATIPLAPQETRRYTTKTVVKKTRNIKEIEDFLHSGKHESANTWRVDAEIVDRAKNQTNFQANAKGSGNIGVYKVEAGVNSGNDQGAESAQTKREFHEMVFKVAQEHRNEHRMEITTEESREDESTSYREIRNPNDELTVTYLFYELQRRYLVDEHLYKVTPVVLVANDVPAPHEVDSAWILRHDWIIKRTILDDSFLPALEYLSANYTGEQITLQTLEWAVAHQKSVVDNISQQVQLANKSLNAAAALLERSEGQEVTDQQHAEIQKQIKAFFDPLGIFQAGAPSDGTSDRAMVEFARDTLSRAQEKVNQLVSDLKTETTALQVAIDKYTAAATKHFDMLAEIDRLRIHVKDNIIYYMQAIWSYEPPDQRYFRLYDLDVPMFDHHTKLDMSYKSGGEVALDPGRPQYTIRFSKPSPSPEPSKLHQIADLDNLLGFKGNYMIFPLVNFHNYMAWYLVHPYISFDGNSVTAADPDPYADLTVDQLRAGMAQIYKQHPETFAANEGYFEETMFRLLSKQNPEMMIVPSNSLYIEALPGTHPLLEDFKLIHRAIDVKKAQAELRKAELENLRLASRLANAEYGDPDIDKVVVVGDNKKVTVDAGS